MREILFRGKRADNGKWVEGGICDYNSGVSIFVVNHYDGSFYEPPHTDLDEIEVIPETIGQYTGLTDKNSNKVFEGDIVKYLWDKKEEIFYIIYNSGEFLMTPIKQNQKDIWSIRISKEDQYIEVIGNIYDNPELLGV